MPVDGCRPFRDLLVDFVDGELDGGELRRVSSHVETCDHCASRVSALRRSLVIAERLWEADHAAQPTSTEVARRGRSRGRVWLGRGIVAAALVAAVIPIVWLSWPRPVEVGPPLTSARLTYADIEFQIWEAGLAARIVATGDALARIPGGAKQAAMSYRQVLADHSDTSAALEALRKLQQMGE